MCTGHNIAYHDVLSHKVRQPLTNFPSFQPTHIQQGLYSGNSPAHLYSNGSCVAHPRCCTRKVNLTVAFSRFLEHGLCVATAVAKIKFRSTSLSHYYFILSIREAEQSWPYCTVCNNTYPVVCFLLKRAENAARISFRNYEHFFLICLSNTEKTV